MSNVFNLSGQQVIAALEKMNFVVTRQKGSHVILKKQTDFGTIGCVVPNHKQLAFGTLKGVLKMANISIQEFEKYL
jgi:predicted RNA binding protein YcfA (HicA-like mRNA interferase family)